MRKTLVGATAIFIALATAPVALADPDDGDNYMPPPDYVCGAVRTGTPPWVISQQTHDATGQPMPIIYPKVWGDIFNDCD